MLLLRDAQRTDLAAISRLAEVLDTVNLPYDRRALAEILDHSVRSFSGRVRDPLARSYVFVAEDARQFDVEDVRLLSRIARFASGTFGLVAAAAKRRQAERNKDDFVATLVHELREAGRHEGDEDGEGQLPPSRAVAADAGDDPLTDIPCKVEDEIADTVVGLVGPPPDIVFWHLQDTSFDLRKIFLHETMPARRDKLPSYAVVPTIVIHLAVAVMTA